MFSRLIIDFICSADFQQGVEKAYENNYDMLLLDVMLTECFTLI